MSVGPKLKELIFECDSEQEALHLLQNYRRKNFHLVSKKSSTESDSMVSIRLIKFKQKSEETNLETVWENFVNQMMDAGLNSSFIKEVLLKIRAKKEFWETHPHDHLRDIVMDGKNFARPEQISKVFAYVAQKNDLKDFYCAYQKSLANAVSSMGMFVLAPKSMKQEVIDLKISKKVQVLTYDASQSISNFHRDIENKIGLILVDPEETDFLEVQATQQYIDREQVSVGCAVDLDSSVYDKLPSDILLVCGYTESNRATVLFDALDLTFKSEVKVAFVWNRDTVGSILNPQLQIIETLDVLLDNRQTQHLSNE